MYTYIRIYVYTYIHIYICIYTYMNIINNSSVPRKGGQVIYHNAKRVVSFLVLLPGSVAAWPQRSVFAIRTLRIRSKGAPLLPLKSVRSSYMDCDFLRQSWNEDFFLYGYPQIINFFMGCSIVNHLILGFSIINHPFLGVVHIILYKTFWALPPDVLERCGPAGARIAQVTAWFSGHWQKIGCSIGILLGTWW